VSAQSCQIYFQTRSGKALTLNKQTLTDGTEAEIKSGGDGLNVVSDISFGQYGVGETVTHGLAMFSDAGMYAFVLDGNGKIVMPIPVSTDVGAAGVVPLCRPLVVQNGMTVRALSTDTGGSQGANVSLSVYCADASVEVFSATASGTTQELVSIQTSQGIGKTLNGKRIIKAYAATPLMLDSGEATGFMGLPILSSEGYTKAVYAASNVLYGQPQSQDFPVVIEQNDKLQVTYDAS
jgi:hypothetical protein